MVKDDEEVILCGCGNRMVWFMDTLVCPICDWLQIFDKSYDYEVWKKGKMKDE